GSLSAPVVATGVVTATVAGRLAVDTAAGTTEVAVAVRNLSLDLGGGLRVSGAVVGLYVAVTSAGTDFALDAAGTVSLTGYAAVTLGGTFRVRVNGFDAAVSQVVAFADGSGDVTIEFGPLEVASVTDPFTAFSGTGLTLGVLGQSMTADLVFAETGTGFTVTVTNLALSFGDGGTPVARFTGGSGTLTMTSATSIVTATLAGDLALLAPGVAFTGTVSLGLSNVSGTSFVRVGITGAPATLTVAGQTLAVTQLTVERTATDGIAQTRIAFTGGAFAITEGTTDLIALTGVTGFLSVTAAGVAGRLTAGISSEITGFTFASTVAVAVNTGSATVGDLPAGPYLRVEATGTTITVDGQELKADVTFERAVDAAGATVVRAGLANGSLVFMAVATTVLSVTNGTGALVVTTGGLAASVSGTVAVGLPGVSFTGALAIQVNTTGGPVDTTVSVGGTDQSLVLPIGPYLRVRGENVVLEVAGQRITGTVTVQRASGITTFAVTGGSLNFGDGVATLTGVAATLTAGATGIWGSFTGTPALHIPGVTISAASLTVEINTDAGVEHVGIAGGTVRVGASSLVVAVAGVEITGTVWFARTVDSGVVTYRVDVSGGRLSLGSYVSVTGITGTFLTTPAGVTGSVSATADLTVPDLVSVIGTSVSVAFNTNPGPVDLVGGVVLPAGPYLRVDVTRLDATIAGGELVGSFAFTRSVDASGAVEIVVAMTGVDAYINAADADPSLYNGEGALIIRSGGVAGFLSGSASFGGSGVSAEGSVLLQVNTTPDAIDTTLLVGGKSIVFKLPAPTSGTIFSLSVSDLTLTIGNFVTIEGNLTFSDTVIGGVPVRVVAASGLTIFLGRGPAFLSSGAMNPLAMGVLLTGATLGLIEMGSGHALVASGNVSLIGVPGVTVTGTTSVRVNTTRQAITTTIEIPGSTDPGVLVSFDTTAEVKQFVVSAASIAFAGQSLGGTFSFDRTGDDLTVSVADGSISFGDAVQFGAITGSLVVRADGIAGSLSSSVTIAALGVGPVTAAVAVNSAPTAVVVGATTLPAGPYVRVSLTGLDLAILGQTIRADIAVERLTSGGVPTTVVGLANVALFLGDDGGTPGATIPDLADDLGVRLTGGSGLLVVTATGLAGRVEGTISVQLGADATLAGNLSLALNTTAARVTASFTVGTTLQTLDIAGGPYLRFEGTGLTLMVLGQSLTANVAIEKVTPLTAAGTPDTGKSTLRIAATGVQLSLGGGVVTLSNGTALILLSSAGATSSVAGRITGTLALAVPQVALSGALAVELNTATTAINQSFTINGETLALVLPPGQYVRVAGTGVALTIAGQSLTTDVEVVDTAGTVTITLRNTRLLLGGATPLVTIAQPATGTGSTATFGLARTGSYGAITVAVTVGVPNVTVTGTINIAFNTTAISRTPAGLADPLAAGLLRVGGKNLTISVLGQTVTGDVTFEQVTTTAGATVVRLGLAGVGLALGPLTASNGTGLFVIAPAGLAGALSVQFAVAGTAPFTLGGNLELQVNTTTARVTETLAVGAGTVSIDVPAGPYLRLAGTGITLGILGQSLRGDFAFERATAAGVDTFLGTADDTTVTRIAAANVELALTAGAARLAITGGTALFVLPVAGGLAGRVSGTVSLTGIPGVAISGSLAVEINTTNALVKETMRVGAGSITVNLPAGGTGGYLRFAGTGISIVVAGQSLAADIVITKTGASLTVAVTNGQLAFGPAGAPVVRATAVNGSLTATATGVVGSLQATVEVAIPSVSLTGTVAVTVNSATGTLAVDITTANLTIAGQSLGATLVTIRRTATGDVSLVVDNLTLSLGTFVNVNTPNNWDGALLVTAQGVAGSFSGSLTGVFTLPGLTVTGQVQFAVNTGTAAVRRPDLGIDVPAGTFLHVAITGGTLAVTGGPSFAGNFLISQTTTPGVTTLSGTITGL
ncbi:MAG: hypothetical protein HHJ13_09000, partial [Phycicoccus sp.]|nr:hypothetical protein [Phycicoccus sp.]